MKKNQTNEKKQPCHTQNKTKQLTPFTDFKQTQDLFDSEFHLKMKKKV